MIEFNLSSFEARVLGVLAEKAFLTPDVYPLSLNATVNACNQLSNRVAKYQHRLSEVFSLDDARLSLLALLLLRGPQTCGELRQRTARMYPFASIESVERSLGDLAANEPSLVLQLPRSAGTKESRWTHLLSGAMAVERQQIASGMNVGGGVVEGSGDDRVSHLEAEVAALRREVVWLTEELAKFKKQFE